MPRVLKRTVKKAGTNAIINVDVTREISTIGDSTDGEDYELPEDTSQSKKYNIVAKMNKYKYEHQYKYKDTTTNRLTSGSTDIKVSCMLKEMGNQLLQHETVRTKYKDIKSQLIPTQEQTSYNNLDELLGRGWGLIVKCYDLKKNKIAEAAADYYFKINKEKIQETCNNDVNYQSLNSNAEKGEYYLQHKVDIQDSFEEIYKLNKALDIQKQREFTEYLPMSEQVDASSFLAAVKASKKLKDLGKNHLCDKKHGTGRLISATSITKKTIQQNETLEISTGGAFKHLKTNEGTYETIGQELQKLIDKQLINKNMLKKFFQFSLKGQECSEIVVQNITKTLQSDTTKENLIDQLKTDIELIFGIEVKRNPAALLTNAMFFDLVDKGIYKIQDIADKMPMAMKGAVPASVIIDIQMGESTYDYRYDYEDAPKGYKEVRNLAGKDEAILQDWLKYKLQETLDEKVKNIQSDPTVRELTNCFQNLNIGVIGLSKKQPIINILKIADYFQCSIDEVVGRNKYVSLRNIKNPEFHKIKTTDVTSNIKKFLVNNVKKQKLNLYKLGIDIGFSNHSLHSFVNGNREQKTLNSQIIIALADYFEVSLDEMVGRIDPAIDNMKSPKLKPRLYTNLNHL